MFTLDPALILIEAVGFAHHGIEDHLHTLCPQVFTIFSLLQAQLSASIFALLYRSQVKQLAGKFHLQIAKRANASRHKLRNDHAHC